MTGRGRSSAVAARTSVDGWSMAWEGRHGHAYDEPVFQYLLDLERTRSAHLGRPLLLVLVELQMLPPGEIDPGCAARLFSVLSGCVRETDIVGWHRRGRVAGIVITELEGSAVAAVRDLLQARLGAALDRVRSRLTAYRLHVRIDRAPRPTGRIPAAASTGAHEC